MKKFYLSVYLLCLLHFSLISFSQVGMGNGGMNGMNGMNGNNGRGMNAMQQPNPGPVKKIDHMAATLDKLSKDLTLDTFQSTVLKGYLEEQKKKEDVVFAEDIIDQAKMDKIQDLRDKFDKKLTSLLSKEQADKYIKIKEGFKKK